MESPKLLVAAVVDSPESSLRSLPSQLAHFRMRSDASSIEPVPPIPDAEKSHEDVESEHEHQHHNQDNDESEYEEDYVDVGEEVESIHDEERLQESEPKIEAEKSEQVEEEEDQEPYSALEVVQHCDEKMVALPDVNDYSTLELAATLFPSKGEKTAAYDFANQNYSTLEIPTSIDIPADPLSTFPSLRRRSSLPGRSRSPSILDAPLPPLPPVPYTHHLTPSRKHSQQTLFKSSQSVRSHVSMMQGPRRIKECGVWFDRRFYAGEGGMEIWMSRNRTFFRDMRWEVICGNQRILGIRGNPNSWNQKREFSDTRGNLLFKMKKAKGKKRVGESKHGAVVFAVQRERDELNASWTVEFTNARDKRTVRWNVRGSATTNDVYVNCYGVPIGRISRPEPGEKAMMNEKNSYVVRVSAGIDYTVMAALTVAYDDYRSESGKSTL